VAKFAPTGQLRFAKLLDTSLLAARDVAITSRGEIALAGWYDGRITLGCSSFDATRDGRAYFASLDGATGDVRWARSLFAQGVRMDAGDAILISGGLLNGANDLGPPEALDGSSDPSDMSRADGPESDCACAVAGRVQGPTETTRPAHLTANASTTCLRFT
jgi:hypothetical protein